MKKRILSMLLAIVMVVGMLPGFTFSASAAEIVASQPANGDGSAENPYQITTVGELYWFATLVNTKAKDGGNNNAHAKLMNNITVNENVIVDGVLTSDTSSLNVWTAMGKTVFSSGWFGGCFDGNGKTISGLYVNGTANYQGFIGCLGEGASVKNLTITDSYFTSTESSLGAFVGTMGLSSAAENPVIENCKLIDSIVSGTSYVGGIVGGGDYGEIISNCHVYNSTITGTGDNVGGIAGSAGDYNNEAYIRLCSVNDSSVSGANNVGGILGEGGRSTTTKISACCNYNTSVSATTKNAGGILGADAACYSCFVTAKVSAPSKQGPFYGSGNSYNSAYDSDVYGESKLFTNSMAFTTDEIEAGAATYYLTDTTSSNTVYVLWGQKIGEDKYPSWNPESNPDYIVYRMDDTENGGYIYYNGDAAAEYEPNEDGIYEIADRSDWYKFAKKAKEDPTIDGILTANIDFTGVASDKMANYVIGVTGKAYTGTFDGDGYTVNNLPEAPQSLFNVIGSGGELKDLNLSGAVLTNMDAVCVAGLVYNNLGVISNVTVTDVTVSSGAVAAGIVVDNRGTVTGCTVSDITVTGKTAAGGIAGINHSGNTIEDCHVVSGTVKSVGAEYDAVAGGICGSSYGGTIEGCTNNADVSAEAGRLETAAGIVGRPDSSNGVSVNIISCSNTGNINGTWAGGISGADSTATYVNISLCYNEGTITGNTAGGIAADGSINADDLIVNCYNAGAVNAVGTRAMAGGIVGDHSNNTIKNCHNYGKVTSEYVAAPISCTDVSVWPGADELINNHAIEGNIDAPNICPYLDTEGAASSLDAIVEGSTREEFANGTITDKLNAGNSEIVWYQYTEYPILEERHLHQWSYTLEGTDTIKAECTQTGCDLENSYGGSMTIVAPADLVYDDTSKDAECTYNEWKPGKPAIVYNDIDRTNVTGQNIVASVTAGEATATVSYQILPREILAAKVNLSRTSASYNGTEYTVTVTVKDDTNKTLTADVDYEITGTTSATDISTGDGYAVTVTGKGNYIGTVTKYWKINKGSLSSQVVLEGWEYLDNPNAPSVTNNPENGEVTYTYYISAGRRPVMTGTAAGAETEGGVPKYAGTYYIGAEIAETEHYTSKKISLEEFTIEPREVTNPIFDGLQASYLYDNGNEIKPAFTLKDDLGNVIPENEYTVAYSNNTAAGEATITITDYANGNYTVNGSKTFAIVVHVHDWKYTSSGAVITAKCEGTIGDCPVTGKTVTITLNAPTELTYDGNAKAVTVTQSPAGVFTDVPVEITGNWINAGEYTAEFTYGEAKATLDFTIEKAAIGTVAVNVTAPVALAAKQTTIADGTGYTAEIAWNTEANTFGFNTAYTATVTLTADSNHKFAEGINIDGWNVQNTESVLTLTKTFDATRKAKLTELTNAPVDKTLTAYHTDAAGAIAELPPNIIYNTESGTATVTIEWSCANYNSAAKATNTFAWSVKAGELDNYDANGIDTTGSITVTNVDALPVTNSGTNQEITYNGETYDVVAMFTKDTNAGEANYAVVGGTGAGTLNGSVLTITKTGTIEIKLTTAANDPYAAGEATATLTVNKAAGSGSVTMEGWTYGDDAKDPVSSGTGTVTYKYSTENGEVPTNAGTYTVTATFAATDLYEEATASATFTIAKKSVKVTAEAKSKFYGDNDPKLTYTADGLVGNDTLSGDLSRVAGENVGTYAITIGTLANSNYTIDFTSANLTVNPKAITVKADAVSKTYGDSDPELTCTATGLVGEDKLSGKLTRSEGENVGTYTIEQGTLTAGDNYTVIYTGAGLTITAKSVIIIGATIEDVLHNAEGTYTLNVTGVTFEGVIDGDSLDYTATASLTGENKVGVAAATVTVTLNNTNYSLATATYETTVNIVEHTHVWSFTASGDTITAICSGTIGTCPNKTQTIKVVAPTGSMVYDGTVRTATIDGSIDGVDTPAITYDGDCMSVGNHTAKIKLGDAEAKMEFTITAATPTIAWTNTTASVDYTGSTAQITAPVVTLVNNETYNSDISYSYTGTSSGNGLPTDAGTYEITASITAQGNYSAAIGSNTLTLTINKVDASVTKIPEVVSSLTYNGEAQKLVKAGTANGGTMVYSTTQNGTYGSIPEESDAGIYTVWYMVEGDSNHNNTEPQSVTVTIAPKVVSNPVIEGIEAQYVHTGSAIAPVPTAVKDGATVIDTGEYTVEYENNINEGTNAAVKIVDKDGGNYTVNGSKTFAIVVHAHDWKYTSSGAVITAKCEGTIGDCPVTGKTVTITLNAPTELTYDGNAKAVTVTQSPAGVFTDVPAEITGDWIKAGTYTAELTYGEAKATLDFTIIPASLADAEIIVESNISYTGNAIEPEVTVKLGSKTLTTVDYTVTYSSNTNVGTATVTVTGKGNYKDSSNTTFTIVKAAAPAIQWPTAGGIVYGQKLSASVLSSNDANGTFAWEDGTIVPTVTNNGYVVVYTPKDTANYDYTDVTLEKTISVSVTAADQADFSISGATTAKYGDPAITLNAAGGSGDGAITWEITSGDAFAEITGNGTTAILTIKGVGTVTVKATKASDGNYNAKVDTHEITISKATVTAGSFSYTAPSDLVYSKTAKAATVTGSEAYGTSTIKYYSDSDLTNVVDPINVGTYYVGITTAGGANYEPLAKTLVGSFTIIARPVAVTAEAKSMKYGEEVPELTYTHNLIEGDSFTGALATDAAKTSDVGTYNIIQGDLSAGNNYTITFTGAKLTVTKADGPAAPTVTGSYTNDGMTYTYTVDAIEGAEYSKNGSTWQDSNVFTGLSAGQKYTFCARIKETKNVNVGTVGQSAEVDLSKLPGNGTVTIAGWTYGENATAPVVNSTTGNNEVTYLYESTDGKGYSGATAPTNAGAYKLTVTFAATTTHNGTTASTDFTIAKATPDVTAPIGLKAAYGDTLSRVTLPDGWAWKDATTTEVGNAGENSFTVIYTKDDSGNYNTVEKTVTITVSPKTVSATVSVVGDSFIFNGSEHKPGVEVKDGENTISASEYTVEYANNTNAGTATITIKDNDGGNYTVSGTTTFEITKKASAALSGVEREFMRTIATTGNEIDVAAMLPDNRGTTTYTITSDGYTVLENVSVDENGKLVFDTKTSAAAASDTIIVKVVMQNYTDVTLTVSVILNEKTPQNITGVAGAEGLIYNGNTQQGYTGTPASEKYTGSYEITYTGRDNSYNSSVAPTDAGEYTVTFKIPDTDLYYSGNVSVNFTIGKEQATVTADDKEVYIGSHMPELTYKVSGLIGDDTIRVELSCDANMNRTGETPIVVTATDPNGNYEITTVNGTLTVKMIYLPIIPSNPTYPPVVDGDDNGDVTVTPKNPEKGDTVTITPDPDAGYEVDEIVVSDKNGNPVEVINNRDGTYSFKQPNGKVNIEVTFKEIIKVCPGDKTCPMYGYTDLDMNVWYHDGVHFCIENKLMNGTSTTTFAPGATTSRAMIVTILWRLAGEPIVNYAMSFDDVASDTWYTEAIRWAVSEGIVNGYSDTAFGPNDNITREQLATILYRYEQKNGGGFTGAWMIRMDYVDLADVSDWAYEAMCWMNMNAVINGKPGKVLDPKGTATRAESATMLQRYCELSGKDEEN